MRITGGSYVFFAVLLATAAWLHLQTLLLTVLFAYFALTKLQFGRLKWTAIVLFAALFAAIGYIFVYFIREAFEALPRIAHTAIPMILNYAQTHGLQLPFDDLESLKVVTLAAIKDQLGYLGNFARIASKEFAFLLIGVVVAISLFINARFETGRQPPRDNFYVRFCEQLRARFSSFFESFERVMGAQLLISAINTFFTALFVLVIDLPHAPVLIVLTFLCGLLPIIGNLVSNTMIVSIAFTLSPRLALAALVFLVVIHKLEYFLNSKIIGDRIKNPVWLTLIALLVGERLMGIPGMILAPVVLHFIKVEVSRIPAEPTRPASEPQELLAANDR